MEHRNLLVPEGVDGERADRAIAKVLGLSRTLVADTIAAGNVQLDGVTIAKSTRVTAGSLLEVHWEAPKPPEVVPMEVETFAVIYDDDDVVVIDKPAGVAAHPSLGWSGPTVLGALAAAGYRISTSGPPERQGIVHRLDVGTSGLMAVAKSELAYSVLKQAFRDRVVEKTYQAVVQGHPDPLSGTIDAPIGRHPGHEWKFAVTSGGRHSITHYVTLEAFRYATQLEVHLETGRTHQIRVHMAAGHHPCVGDEMYGADPKLSRALGLERQWLHATHLSFAHPRTGERLDVSSEIPHDLRAALDALSEGIDLT